MQRITEIRLRNYRAFGDREEIIPLPKGENLLVYGENGSGKSSLCSAVLTVLDASFRKPVNYAANRFLAETETGYIRVSFRDTSNAGSLVSVFEVGKNPSVNSAENNAMLRKAYLARGYLSYQEIVRTYLLSEDDGENLYDLLITRLLSHHKLESANNILAEVWKGLVESIGKKPLPFTRRLDNEISNRNLIREFSADLDSTIQQIVSLVNRV